MKKIQTLLAASAVSLLAVLPNTPVLADEGGALLDKSKFSIGGGLLIDSDIGFQVFGKYELDMINLADGIDSSVDFGYTDYGLGGGGLWGTYVIDGPINGKIGWLGRLGFDLGDDSGLMVGVGAGYAFSPKMDMRLEYVLRDNVDGLQFNILFHL